MDRNQLAVLRRKFIRETEEFIEANLHVDRRKSNGEAINHRPIEAEIEKVVEEMAFDFVRVDP